MKLKTYLRFENMYHNGELFNASNFDVYWSADNTTCVSVGEKYVVFGITEKILIMMVTQLWLYIKEICMKVLCMRKTILGVMVVC